MTNLVQFTGIETIERGSVDDVVKSLEMVADRLWGYDGCENMQQASLRSDVWFAVCKAKNDIWFKNSIEYAEIRMEELKAHIHSLCIRKITA